jgi:flagellar motor protein MotB
MNNPGYTALVEGHADEQGTREYNVALGARRASAVQDFLVTQAWRRTGCGRSPTARNVRSRSVRTKAAGVRIAAR